MCNTNMKMAFFSRHFLYRLLNIFFSAYFLASGAGYLYSSGSENKLYLGGLIVLLAIFSFYYYYILQHPEVEFFKKGKGTRILLGLVLLANLIVQLTGGAVSVLFPIYYLVTFLIIFRYSVRIAYYTVSGMAVLEYASTFFQKTIETNGILLLIKLIFLLLLVFIFDTMNSYLRVKKKKMSSYPLTDPVSTPAQETDTIELLSTHSENQSRLSIDQELFNTLTSILVLVKNIFQPYTCAIFYFSPQRNESILYIYNTESHNIIPNAAIRTGEGLVGWLTKELKPLIVGNLTSDSRTLLYYDTDEQIRSFIGVPFIMNGQLEGTLILDSKQPDAFASDDQGVLMNFSQLIVSFIHKSRLMFELKQSTTQVSGFYEISKLLNSHLYQSEVVRLLVDVVKKMFPFHRIVLALADDRNENFVVKYVVGRAHDLAEGATFALTEKGRVGWVYQYKEICLISDLERGTQPIPRYRLDEDSRHGFKSFLAAPLMIEHRPIGVVCLESDQKNEYTERDKEKMSIIMNIAEMALSKAHLYQRMENLATIDGLTNLANHRHFQNILGAEIRRAKRHNLSIALLMIDIDYFKQINDNYGHQAGDYILVEIATLLKDTVREVDLVARYGGEEFAVVLVGDRSLNSDISAERIRAKICKHKFNTQSRTLQVTISIGIAIFPTDSDSQSDLIRMADKALYKAKESGRDCIKTSKDLVAPSHA
jgi:two-component system, cell cycle response regulator